MPTKLNAWMQDLSIEIEMACGVIHEQSDC